MVVAKVRKGCGCCGREAEEEVNALTQPQRLGNEHPIFTHLNTMNHLHTPSQGQPIIVIIVVLFNSLGVVYVGIGVKSLELYLKALDLHGSLCIYCTGCAKDYHCYGWGKLFNVSLDGTL
jgi:hypothetical protein